MSNNLSTTHDLMEPPYYHSESHDLEPFDIMRLWTEDTMSKMEAFFRFNALKYLWRYPNKNGIDDLIKCRNYIDLLIQELSE